MKNIEVSLQEFGAAYLNNYLFGAARWPPNLHFVYHMPEDIRRFGPPSAYHCFAMERFNGLLEAITTDNRAPQQTMMRTIRHFQVLSSQAVGAENPLSFSEAESKAWISMTSNKASCDITPPLDGDALVAWHQLTTGEVACLGNESLADIKLLNPVKTRHVLPGATATNIQVMDADLRDKLTRKLEDLFGGRPVVPRVSVFVRKFKRAKIFGTVIGSELWHKGKQAFILHRFVHTNYRRRISTMWPGKVQFFFSVDLLIDPPHVANGRTQVFQFALCRWFQAHTHADRLSNSVWKKSFAPSDMQDIVPGVYNSSCFTFLFLRDIL